MTNIPTNRGERHPLPSRRACETFSIHFANRDWEVTLGEYPNGEPGEVFVTGGKSGTDIEAVARDGAILLSLAMQYGVPLDVVRKAITRNADGSPSTIVGAILDHIAKETTP